MFDYSKVSHVLLADGWHGVENKSFSLRTPSFTNFLRGMTPTQGEYGTADWMEGSGRVACPLSSVLAIKMVN